MSAKQAGHYKKLPGKLKPVVFAFYMSAIMAALMCFIITAANQGFGDHYLLTVFHAYEVAMPSAFFCVLLVRPVVMKLLTKTVADT